MENGAPQQQEGPLAIKHSSAVTTPEQQQIFPSNADTTKLMFDGFQAEDR